MSVRCLLCPRCCTKGYGCKKGESFAKEASFEGRVLTTTVEVEGGTRVPVRSKDPLPKDRLREAILLLRKKKVHSPVKRGQVIVKKILNLSDIIATCSIPKE